MAKIKIAQNPTFTGVVKVPRLGGEPESVEFEFRYLDRDALADLYDGWNKAMEANAEKAKAEDWTLKQYTASQIQLQVEQVKAVVVGWAFEDEFSDEAILALVKTCTGAPQAVISAYQEAYNPARLGN